MNNRGNIDGLEKQKHIQNLLAYGNFLRKCSRDAGYSTNVHQSLEKVISELDNELGLSDTGFTGDTT